MKMTIAIFTFPGDPIGDGDIWPVEFGRQETSRMNTRRML
jgi:hypothetical protein